MNALERRAHQVKAQTFELSAMLCDELAVMAEEEAQKARAVKDLTGDIFNNAAKFAYESAARSIRELAKKV